MPRGGPTLHQTIMREAAAVGRNWRPRSVFSCDLCYVWRVRVSAPRCCQGRLCSRVPDEDLNEAQRRQLDKANRS